MSVHFQPGTLSPSSDVKLPPGFFGKRYMGCGHAKVGVVVHKFHMCNLQPPPTFKKLSTPLPQIYCYAFLLSCSQLKLWLDCLKMYSSIIWCDYGAVKQGVLSFKKQSVNWTDFPAVYSDNQNYTQSIPVQIQNSKNTLCLKLVCRIDLQ